MLFVADIFATCYPCDRWERERKRADVEGRRKEFDRRRLDYVEKARNFIEWICRFLVLNAFPGTCCSLDCFPSRFVCLCLKVMELPSPKNIFLSLGIFRYRTFNSTEHLPLETHSSFIFFRRIIVEEKAGEPPDTR